MWLYLACVVVLYASGLTYAAAHGLSIRSLYLYGLLQPPGISGEEARLVEIATPVSWNVPQVLWFIYIKAAGVLVELFQYWVVGMLIAAALVVFVSWEKVKAKMGYGGFKANLLATTAGAVIPICSCGIVPVLAGMVEVGIPLGPTMVDREVVSMGPPAMAELVELVKAKLAAVRAAGGGVYAGP